MTLLQFDIFVQIPNGFLHVLKTILPLGTIQVLESIALTKIQNSFHALCLEHYLNALEFPGLIMCRVIDIICHTTPPIKNPGEELAPPG
jgi:hypothetical protein